MGTRLKKTERKIKYRRWLIGILVGLASILVAVANLFPDLFPEIISVPDISAYEAGTSYHFNNSKGLGVEEKDLRAELNDGGYVRAMVFETKNKVSYYDDIEHHLYFNIFNDNDFSVAITNIYVDVVSYEPYTDYLYISLITPGAGDSIQTFSCDLKPNIGRYHTKYEPLDEITGKPINPVGKYLKIESNDSEVLYIHANTDTEGIYGLKVTIEYNIKNEIYTRTTEDTLFFAKDPVQIDFINHAFYYSSSEMGADENGFYQEDIVYVIPNYINGIDTDSKIMSFLNATYKHPDLYLKAIKSAISLCCAE